LSWSFTTSTGNCGPYGGTFTEWYYNNFNYLDPNGVNHSLGGGAVYFSATQPAYCPNGPGATLVINYPTAGFDITFSPMANGQGSATLELVGSLTPRYQLLSLLYAPPGHASYVDYATTTTIGTSTTITSSFTNSSQSSYSLGIGTGKNGPCGKGNICASGSTTSGSGFTQEQDGSYSVGVTQQSGWDIKIYGPQANVCLGQTNTQMDALGLDHDYDQFIVWLNPEVNLAGSPGAIYWTGYSYNSQDTANNIHYVFLSPGQLKDPNFPGDLQGSGCYAMPGLYHALQRTWDTSGTSGGAALTSSDFATILSYEPFANDPHATSTAVDQQRYGTPLGGMTIDYETNQVATNYNTCYDTTFASNTGETDTYTDSFGWDITFSFFEGVISGDLKSTSTMTIKNGWSQSDTSKVGQCATVSITGPPAGSGYPGTPTFDVYQDHLYGTFMLYPVN
jgi:hypothetical protein